MESTSLPIASKWEVGEHIDAKDTTERWCNAEIIKIDHQKRSLRIHYSGCNSKYDETLPIDSDRVQKQCKQISLVIFFDLIGKRGMVPKVNNRLDIYDPADKKWREAIVIEVIAGSKIPVASIKVHYKGYSAKSDNWVDCVKEEPRIKEVGSFSNAEGHAKYSQRIQ